jgi:hypothetical membrane protein
VLRQLSAAVLVPFCYFGSLLLAGFLYPGYSHVTQLPSELGAAGAPHPLIFNAGLVLTGLALVVATPGIAHSARYLGATRLWATSLVLALLPAGIYFVLVGVISLPDPRHNALFPMVLPLQLGPFLLALSLRHRREARGFLRYLVATGILLLVLLLVGLGLGGLVTTRNQGFFIRVYAVVAFSWIGVAGALLRGWIGAVSHPAPASAT